MYVCVFKVLQSLLIGRKDWRVESTNSRAPQTQDPLSILDWSNWPSCEPGPTTFDLQRRKHWSLSGGLHPDCITLGCSHYCLIMYKTVIDPSLKRLMYLQLVRLSCNYLLYDTSFLSYLTKNFYTLDLEPNFS